ncbi:MAG TPA: carbohydrate porin [Vicinamibacterales bacterium]|nr:carbohydrate porin [Vicinamibacterales bacterium]
MTCPIDWIDSSAVRRFASHVLVALTLVLAAITSAGAQSFDVPASPPQTPSGTQIAQPSGSLKDFANQSNLFGDWGGARTKMEQNGTTLGVSFIQFFDWAPTTSSLTNDVVTKYYYGGKFDVRDTSDLSRVAWKGLSVHAHLEVRFGDVPLLAGGTLIPTNAALIFPAAEDTKVRLTGLSFTQVLNPHVVVSMGRFNTLELYNGRQYAGGEGLDKFMNLAFVAPPLSLKTVPPVAEGVIFTVMRGSEVAANAGLIESTDQGFFKNGATVLWNVTLPIKPFSLPGHYSFGGEFSSTVGTNLDQNPWILLPPFNNPALTKQGAWTLNFTFDQTLVADPQDAAQNLGAFGTIGVSDGNPSLIQPYFIFGFGGHTLLKGRPNDTFGIGYFFTGVSNDFRTSVEPVRLRDEQGGEFYYNFAAARWSLITADLQFVDPFAVGSRTRTFFAVRWKLVF